MYGPKPNKQHQLSEQSKVLVKQALYRQGQNPAREVTNMILEKLSSKENPLTPKKIDTPEVPKAPSLKPVKPPPPPTVPKSFKPPKVDFGGGSGSGSTLGTLAKR